MVLTTKEIVTITLDKGLVNKMRELPGVKLSTLINSLLLDYLKQNKKGR